MIKRGRGYSGRRIRSDDDGQTWAWVAWHGDAVGEGTEPHRLHAVVAADNWLTAHAVRGETRSHQS